MLVIRLENIPTDGHHIHEIADSAQVSWDDPDIVILDPIELSCTINHSGDKIALRGTIHSKVGVPCARCLEQSIITIDDAFDIELNLTTAAETMEDYDLLTEKLQTNGEIDLGIICREYIYLNVPLQVLCKSDCKGLCPQCGNNRNLEPCDCKQSAGKATFSLLSQLSLKEQNDIEKN